ncbi:uncharacterized protein LOC125015253 [Mugil cephalus]|uniref:uncharacterized protein LOC125015253 n=1 Tax=Mugil cephalus TaxID=48193 RepID=UPI001FB6A59B|nr:uncharacterized protein LOC125015253 [Mugil cephalus]
MDRGDGSHTNFFDGEERRRRLDLVEDIAQSGQFNEEEIAWLRFVVRNGQEREATAYLRHIIAERDNANYDNVVFAVEDLDTENEDLEADDELDPLGLRHCGPPDIFNRESDTDSEDEALGGSTRRSRGEDEDSDQMNSQQFRCPSELTNVVSSSDIANNIMEENPAPVPSLGPVREASSGWLRYNKVSDISDWESDTENSTDHEAPLLAPSSSQEAGGSRRSWKKENGSDSWMSSNAFGCSNSVPHTVFSSDFEEEHPESAPSSSIVPERSKKRERDGDEEEDGHGSK